MCQLLGPATAFAAVPKDQSSRAVHDPGDAVATVVEGSWGIRFGINPTGLCSTEIIWFGMRVGAKGGMRLIWVCRWSH